MSERNDYNEDKTINLEIPTHDPIPETTEKKSKKYRPRSQVWAEFEKFTDNDGVHRSRCKHYGDGKYKCDFKAYGTGNLNLHLKKCKAYLAKVSGGQTNLAFQYGDQNKLTAWRFDQQANRKDLAYMLVVDELPFSFVEGQGYRYYNSVSQPLFKVPCRSTITIDTYHLFEEENENVHGFIKANIGRICLTTDTWTSTLQKSYMCLTAHFVDNEWKLKKKVLSFCPQEGHRGVEIGKTVEKCLINWEIENVITISVDNVSANDVAIELLKKRVQNSTKCLLNAKWTHIRCVAHILNLVMQDDIKKVDRSVETVRWAVKWIRQSTSRMDKFYKIAKKVNCGTTKHLIRDVSTRWNVTYHMLEIAQGYEKAFERYDLEEFDFRTDIVNAGLSVPLPSNWEKVRHLCNFLKPIYEVALRVSGTRYVTSNTCIEDNYTICTVLKEAFGDASLCEIAMVMRVKFDKYFGDIEKTNLLLYFALVLDLRNKVKYLLILLDDCYGLYAGNVVEEKKKYIMDSMYELYNDYVRIHSPSSDSSTTESTTSLSVLGKRQNPDAMAPKPR